MDDELCYVTPGESTFIEFEGIREPDFTFKLLDFYRICAPDIAAVVSEFSECYLERLSAETGVGVEELRVIVRSASHRYKTYTIPKRDGGRREISQPTPAVNSFRGGCVVMYFHVFPFMMRRRHIKRVRILARTPEFTSGRTTC